MILYGPIQERALDEAQRQIPARLHARLLHFRSTPRRLHLAGSPTRSASPAIIAR